MEHPVKAADVVSASVVGAYLFFVVRWAEGGDARFLVGALGAALTNAAIEVIKKALPDSPAFRRPAGAIDCGALCGGGRADGAPGFPSGHAALAAFFFAYMYLLSPTPTLLALGVAGVAAVCAARVAKRCHTPAQVCAGAAFGAVAAACAARLVRKK